MKKHVKHQSDGSLLIGRRRFIPDPKQTDDTDEQELQDEFMQQPFVSLKDYESTFPRHKLPEFGAWILIKDPPTTQYTVPPFSIWFATPWPFEQASDQPVPKRAKIMTPAGELGVFPHEYSLVEDVSTYFGREAEGVLVHQTNDQPAVDRDHLFYLQSRGIRRQEAMKMLVATIKDPSWLWIECAPPYGDYFGKSWPTPKQCPFATPLEQWQQVQLTA